MSHLCSRIYSRFLFSIGSGLNSSAKFSRTLITWLHSIYSSLFSPTPQWELSLSLGPASVSLPFHCQMMLCYGLPKSFLISVQFSRSVVSGSLRPRGLQHARLPGPTPAPRACSNSCPSSSWWHPTILSSVPFSSCLHSFLASGSFPMSQFFASGGQSIGASASASVLPMNIQYWFPLGLTGLISLLSNGLSSLLKQHNLKASILWCSAFFTVQLSHPCRTTRKTIVLRMQTFVGKVMSPLFNMLSRFVIVLLPRSKRLLIS